MPDGAAGQGHVLPVTGERTVPGVWHENYWFRRHEVVYQRVADMVDQRIRSGPGTTVALDAGCGEGFGSQLLARRGARVVALDYDTWAMSHLARAHSQIPSVRGNLVSLPLADRTVDVLVSLQTIEHLWDQDAFVAECARVLRPGGQLVISTPNRHTFPPGNVFHHRELDADELSALLTPVFADVAVRGVHHGPRLATWEREHGDLVAAQIERTAEEWDGALVDVVTSTITADFVMSDDPRDSKDLVVTAVAR